MRQVGSGLGKCFLSYPALCYVLNGADNLGPAIAASGPMGNGAHILDGTVWHPQPDLVFEDGGAAGPRCLDLLRQQRQVFRMDSTADPLEGHGGFAVKLVDAIELFGKRDFVRVETPQEATA